MTERAHAGFLCSPARAWDGLQTHRVLASLMVARARFRLNRTLRRIRSPRRMIATALSATLFLLYLLNGIFILTARETADPERLRLWLSGGMVIYVVYHAVRCGWSSSVFELELTPSEMLWLGGGPVSRSSLVIYHVGSMVIAAAVKTLLLAIVLIRDVNHFELLIFGLFNSLILLEITRLIFARVIAGLGKRHRQWFRLAVTSVAIAITLQGIAIVMAMTPVGSQTWRYLMNGFHALGDVASTPVIHCLAVPWIPAADLTVTQHYQLMTGLQVLATAVVLSLSIFVLIHVDRWSTNQQHRREQATLASGKFATRETNVKAYSSEVHGRLMACVEGMMPECVSDIVPMMVRQSVSVRRYGATIMFSFFVPTLICLSPLITGQVTEQWLFVVGGITLCTLLLAPPALRIDFRRDLKRMQLLKSLPIRPFSMVVGQLAFPVLITWLFQGVTIVIAAWVTQPGWGQVILWTGMLAALAIFTFALENALFLAYPHHERSEGVAMMIRVKLMFLGKGSLTVIALALLILWATLCRNWLPTPYVPPVFVAGAVLASWCAAIVGMATAMRCWQRFDLASDTPPE